MSGIPLQTARFDRLFREIRRIQDGERPTTTFNVDYTAADTAGIGGLTRRDILAPIAVGVSVPPQRGITAAGPAGVGKTSGSGVLATITMGVGLRPKCGVDAAETAGTDGAAGVGACSASEISCVPGGTSALRPKSSSPIGAPCTDELRFCRESRCKTYDGEDCEQDHPDTMQPRLGIHETFSITCTNAVRLRADTVSRVTPVWSFVVP